MWLVIEANGRWKFSSDPSISLDDYTESFVPYLWIFLIKFDDWRNFWDFKERFVDENCMWGRRMESIDFIRALLHLTSINKRKKNSKKFIMKSSRDFTSRGASNINNCEWKNVLQNSSNIMESSTAHITMIFDKFLFLTSVLIWEFVQIKAT